MKKIISLLLVILMFASVSFADTGIGLRSTDPGGAGGNIHRMQLLNVYAFLYLPDGTAYDRVSLYQDVQTGEYFACTGTPHVDGYPIGRYYKDDKIWIRSGGGAYQVFLNEFDMEVNEADTLPGYIFYR